MKTLKSTIYLLSLGVFFILASCSKDAPEAEFKASSTNIMVGATVDFTDLSSNEPTEWLWTFEGGSPASSSEKNPKGIRFSEEGQFSITLVATNAEGSNSITKTAYIRSALAKSPPIADFKASSVSIDVRDEIDFEDLSINGATKWTWQFEGGTPSSASVQNPRGIEYKEPGTFSVTLIAENAHGVNETTKTGYILVNQKAGFPVAEFEASKTEIPQSNSINFTDKSTGNPVSWNWTFDGAEPETSTDQNPMDISYPNTGKYTVILKVTNANGEATKTKKEYITVTNPLFNIPRTPQLLVIKSGATNCPPAGTWGWDVWEKIISKYGDKIVPITIHSDNFVARDFKNQESDDIEKYLKTNGWPAFSVGGNEKNLTQLKAIGNTTSEVEANMIKDIDGYIATETNVGAACKSTASTHLIIVMFNLLNSNLQICLQTGQGPV